jgi:hypothetical protein
MPRLRHASRRSSTRPRRRRSRMIATPTMLTRMHRHPTARAKATGSMALQTAAQARVARITEGAARCQAPPRALHHRPWRRLAGPLRGPRHWRRRAAQPRGHPLRAHGASRQRRQRRARGGAPASRRRPRALLPLLPAGFLETHPWRQGPRAPPRWQRPQRARRRSRQVGDQQPRPRRMPACLRLIPTVARGKIVRTFPGSICPPGVRRLTMMTTATTLYVAPSCECLCRACAVVCTTEPDLHPCLLRWLRRREFTFMGAAHSLGASRHTHTHTPVSRLASHNMLPRRAGGGETGESEVNEAARRRPRSGS